jgi:hypothetical protein
VQQYPQFEFNHRQPARRQSRDVDCPARSGAYAASLRDTSSVKSRTRFVLRVSPCVRSQSVPYMCRSVPGTLTSRGSASPIKGKGSGLRLQQAQRPVGWFLLQQIPGQARSVESRQSHQDRLHPRTEVRRSGCARRRSLGSVARPLYKSRNAASQRSDRNLPLRGNRRHRRSNAEFSGFIACS